MYVRVTTCISSNPKIRYDRKVKSYKHMKVNFWIFAVVPIYLQQYNEAPNGVSSGRRCWTLPIFLGSMPRPRR